MQQSMHLNKQNVIQTFFFDTHHVRIVVTNDAIWFVAKDVVTLLEYSDLHNMTRFLDEDNKSTHNMSGHEGNQELTIINESGLYVAILKSRNSKAAKKFKKWVISEVLPTIRKKGVYIQHPERLELAIAAASEVVDQVTRAVFEAVLLSKDFDLKYGRWIFQFKDDHDGKLTPSVRLIQNAAMIVSMSDLPSRITAPNGIYPTNKELVNLAMACNKRLAERIDYEERKKITAQ